MSTKKKTFEEVYNYFKENGCELLEDTYINCKTPMKYRCSCGRISKITWSKFKSGQRCMKCGRLKTIKGLKYSYKQVQKIFRDNGCELLSKEYINAQTPVEYRCSCGNVSKMKVSHFTQGHKCKKCKCCNSTGEKLIGYYLKNNNYIYRTEYVFEDMKYKGSLRCDFVVFNNDNSIKCVIEFDGIQHFKPRNYFGGEDGLKETQARDNAKNEYCKNNNIKLIRIPYWEKENIDNILQENL